MQECFKKSANNSQILNLKMTRLKENISYLKSTCKKRKLNFELKNHSPEQGLEPWTVRLKA